MDYKYIMIRYGEIGTKGKNKKQFISCLYNNIKNALKQFKEDVLEDMSKGEFQVFDKIKLCGKEDSQVCKVNCKKTKFKKFKALMKDADITKLAYVDIVMVDGIAQELDDDDAVVIAKMIKRICKKYDALVKCKSL